VIFYKITDEKKTGFIASKKIGNSVKRNLAKRRLRAIFIELCDELTCGTYVFVAKEGINKASYKELKSSILWSFKKLGCI
jgi:ribonuclease P protein component